MANEKQETDTSQSVKGETDTKGKIKFALEVVLMLIVGYLVVMPLTLFVRNFLL